MERSNLDEIEQKAAAATRSALLDAMPCRPLLSRLLHRIDGASASSAAAGVAAAVSLAFLLGAVLARRYTAWLTAFKALAAAVTLVMVFTLQHTQSRQQAALQRKLDEILRVLPGGDPRLLRLEAATQEQIDAANERQAILIEEKPSSSDSDSYGRVR